MKKRNRKQGIKDIKLISNVIHILSATEVLLFEFKISFEVTCYSNFVVAMVLGGNKDKDEEKE